MDKDKQLKLQVIEEDIEVVDEEVELPTQIQPQTMTLDKMMEMAEMLSNSTIVPTDYRKRPENVLVALDFANRLGLSPMNVMQNLYVVNGNPSFSGQFLAGLIRSTPLFSDVEVVWVDRDNPKSPEWGCRIEATETRTGRRVRGTTVNRRMIELEGWANKGGSKWKTMPEQMVQYRAFAFFARSHASELLGGVYDVDEMEELRSRKQSSVINPYETGDK